MNTDTVDNLISRINCTDVVPISRVTVVSFDFCETLYSGDIDGLSAAILTRAWVDCYKMPHSDKLDVRVM